MKAHARIEPGIITDPGGIFVVHVHEPWRKSGITIKLWELESYVAPEGGKKRDGNKRDLLAELTGDLAPSAQPGGPPRFTLSRAKIATDDKEGALPAIKLAVFGDETIHRLPLPSQKDEGEARSHEIGLTLEHGGAEIFASKAPCLFHPPPISATARMRVPCPLRRPAPRRGDAAPAARAHRLLRGRGAKGAPPRARERLRRSARPPRRGAPEPDDQKPPPQPLALRSDRKLFVYVHRDAPAAATGPSKIPIALCDPVDADGIIRHRRLVAPHRWSFRMLEQPIDMAGGEVKLGELRPGDAPPLADDELARLFQAFADALPKLDGDA